MPLVVDVAIAQRHSVARIAVACALAALCAAPAQAVPRPHDTPAAASAAMAAPAPGVEHLDLPAWLDYKARAHLTALPMESRLFYRRGLMLHSSGSVEEALRDVR